MRTQLSIHLDKNQPVESVTAKITDLTDQLDWTCFALNVEFRQGGMTHELTIFHADRAELEKIARTFAPEPEAVAV